MLCVVGAFFTYTLYRTASRIPLLTIIIVDYAKNKSNEAVNNLYEHYLCKSKPINISYREFALYKMAADDTTTTQKTANETISDNLLIAIVLKELP